MLERRHHGRHLQQLAEQRRGGFPHLRLAGPRLRFLEHSPGDVLRVGDHAESRGARVGLASPLPDHRAARGRADRQHEQSRCGGIERAHVADRPHAQTAARAHHHVVRGHPGRLVHGQQTRPSGRALSPALDQAIAAEWKLRLAQAEQCGRLLFDGELLRYVDHRQIEIHNADQVAC